MLNRKYLILLFIVLLSGIKAETKDKLNIAVLDLKPINIDKEESFLVTEVLRSELFRHGIFNVMNREDMKEIMGELAFQNSGLCDETSCLIEIGKILSVRKLITGTIGKMDSTYSVTVKQIDIESSQNDNVFNYTEKCSKEFLFEISKKAAAELSGKEYAIPLTSQIQPGAVNAPSFVDLEGELALFTTFNDSAEDLSGYKNDGRINDCVFAPDKYSIPGNALKFNGKSSMVDFGNSHILDFYRNSSIMVNFMLDSLPPPKNSGFLLFKDKSYFIAIDSNGILKVNFETIAFKSTSGKTVSQLIVLKDHKLECSKWYNLIVITDLENGELNLYLDNNLLSTNKIKRMRTNNSNGNLLAGTNGRVSYFNGVIDDIRIYRRSLNRAEIDSLFKIQEWINEKKEYEIDCIYGAESQESAPSSRAFKTTDRFGAESEAVYFNGCFSFDKYDHILRFDSSLPFSISFWFLQENISPRGYRIFDKSTPGRSDGIILDTCGNKYPGQQLRWLPNYEPIEGKTRYSLNEWHHAVLTYDGRRSKIFLDGKIDGESSDNLKIENNDLPLIIGASQELMKDTDLLFKGKIDDIIIYSKVLKPEEVRLIYHEKGWK